MATIVDGKKRIPFLRGMLAHYLIEHGFAFQEAYKFADGIRRSLQKEKDINAEDMADLVRKQVQSEFGNRMIGDAIFWEPSSRQIFIEEGEDRVLFSLERLADSLEAIGLDHDLTHQIASEIAQKLLSSQNRVIKRPQLFKITQKSLKDGYGSQYAERYEAWYQFRRDQQHKPLIILISGATGVGKTSVGLALANQLKISRVASTDAIRQIMRLMISPELMPALHTSSFSAWQHTGAELGDEHPPVVQAFREQAVRVGVGVRAMIERAIEEHVSLIIDGVHLLPDLIDLSTYKDRATFIWMILYLDDKKQYAERFEFRSTEAMQRASHRYVENLDAILQIQQHILEVGEAHRIMTVENANFDETVQSLSAHIMDVLRKRY